MRKYHSIFLIHVFVLFSCSTEDDTTIGLSDSNSQIVSSSEDSIETSTEDTNVTLDIITDRIVSDPTLFNYDTSFDYWGKTVDFYPNVFFASDLSEKVISGMTSTLMAAANEFGKYGPVEYWVFGTDFDSAISLINQFCDRRVALNQWSQVDCFSREADQSLPHSMIAYQKIGEQVVATNQPQGSAGHNGGRDWGIHRLSHSYPFGFDNFFEFIPPQDDAKVVIHEYFHVVQLASIYSTNYEVVNSKLGNIWFHEGGAEYMANYTLFKLMNNETLLFDDRDAYGNLRSQMTQKMNFGKEFIQSNCPSKDFSSIQYSDSCSNAAYDLGAWAIAYLLNKVDNQNALKESFYPNLDALGWEGAFEDTFGYSSQEFIEEFQSFLDLPIEEQIEIIPDI
jgi:hypothetical protein